MAHEHHRCECPHAKVKFCTPCGVTHCLDCKMEWSHTPCTRLHASAYNPWTWSSQYTGGIGSSLTAQQGLAPQHGYNGVNLANATVTHVAEGHEH